MKNLKKNLVNKIRLLKRTSKKKVEVTHMVTNTNSYECWARTGYRDQLRNAFTYGSVGAVNASMSSREGHTDEKRQTII